jgi:hypothetical protein
LGLAGVDLTDIETVGVRVLAKSHDLADHDTPEIRRRSV